MDERVEYVTQAMHKIIRSWGWNMAEYRYLLEALVPNVLFMACAFAIENFVYDLESEAERRDERKVRRYCKWVRQQRERVVDVGLQGGFVDESPFHFQGIDAAKFDREGNLRIYLNEVYQQAPGEPDLNVVVIPAGIIIDLECSPFLSDRDKAVMKLTQYKSEVAQSKRVNPRKYWPREENKT